MLMLRGSFRVTLQLSVSGNTSLEAPRASYEGAATFVPPSHTCRRHQTRPEAPPFGTEVGAQRSECLSMTHSTTSP